jgi:ubiquinone biosynthesis UbiH/UbiF/VisC/COQ6 family hydroxylase
VWQRITPARIVRVESMRIYGDRPPARLEFSAYDAGLRELAFIVENRAMVGALWQALDRADHVSVMSAARCAGIAWHQDRAVVSLENGARLQARLIIGADGAESWVREQAGVRSHSAEYHQTGVVANFETERPHHATAFQWFRPDGVLALLPLAGDRASMVWSTAVDFAQALMRAPHEQLCRAVEEASAGALGRLQVITPPAGFPLRRLHVDRLVEPRVALVGDAAHAVHPLAGQGLNLGLRDVRQLAAVLGARGAASDWGDYRLLRRYERARREDVSALELTTDGLQKLFGARAVWLAGLRNLGLGLLDAQPPLKNLLIRQAVA